MFKKKQESTFRALFEAEGNKVIYVSITSRLIFLLQKPAEPGDRMFIP